MNDRLLSFLGLCKKAGYLISGAETVTKSMREGRAKLVMLAADLSDNTKKEVKRAAGQYGVNLRELSCDKDELSFALGKHCGVICVTDGGFADKILTMLTDTHH